MSRQGRKRPRTPEEIRAFWNAEADDWGDNPQVTIRDHNQRLLEIGVISQMVAGSSRMLDIGCGSGFASLHFAQQVTEVVAEDYAESMVERAQRFLDDPAYFDEVMREYAPDGPPPTPSNLSFGVGNILDIHHPDASFDVVVTERVLINLPATEVQVAAAAEVARVLRPGGTWVMVEVTSDGHAKVDELRKLFGLPQLEKYWHNLYLDEEPFRQELAGLGLRLDRQCRFETYQFLTKVLHPAAVAPDEPQFLSGFNHAARLAATDHLTHDEVAFVGYEDFFARRFRSLLEVHEPVKVAGYDAVVAEMLPRVPDFRGCSHQVLWSLVRS